MKRTICTGILSAAVVAAGAGVQAQTNVYSVAIYSAGNSWAPLCSLTFPFPPYQYKLTDHSWYEDANGLTIIDAGHEQARGGMLRRVLEVECSSNSFTVPLDSTPPMRVTGDLGPPGAKGSGDLARLVTQCVTNRGGHLAGTAPSVAPISWVLHSRAGEDLIVVEGDHFTEIQKFLEQARGAPDSTIDPAVPPGNGRSLTYTPQQIGVVLNLTADSRETIVSVIGRGKP